MAPLLAGVLTTLIQNNLPGVAQAVVNKGMEYVQEKTGIELKPNMSAAEIAALRESAIKHEEFRIEQHNKNTADASRPSRARGLKLELAGQSHGDGLRSVRGAQARVIRHSPGRRSR